MHISAAVCCCSILRLTRVDLPEPVCFCSERIQQLQVGLGRVVPASSTAHSARQAQATSTGQALQCERSSQLSVTVCASDSMHGREVVAGSCVAKIECCKAGQQLGRAGEPEPGHRASSTQHGTRQVGSTGRGSNKVNCLPDAACSSPL